MRYKYITVIPARGGSKRFPGKNVHPFDGKPLIASTIDYSLRNPSVSGTFVSTDSDRIREVALHCGADVIDRPAELAGDYVTSAAVMKHAVLALADAGYDFDYVILLQATNPLRPAGMLDEAVDIIEKGGHDSLFTVSECRRKLGRINDGRYIPWNYRFGQRSQDMEPLYYENGLLYITRKDLLLNEIIEGPAAYPLVVNHPFGEVDIDTEEDLAFAEFMLERYGEG